MPLAKSEIQSLPRYFGKIQDKDDDYYLQFTLVICGLDSVEARRWMNATLVNLVDPDNLEDTLKPMIDGGTEGLFPVFSILTASSDHCCRVQGSGSRHFPNDDFML